jgi:hypothetical protein
MEQTLRPHRAGTVLALGILGVLAGLSIFLRPGILTLPLLLLAIAFGLLAWRKGSKDLKGMKKGDVDPSGRSQTQVGWVFGIASSLACLFVTGVGVLSIPGREFSQSKTPGRENARLTQEGFTIWLKGPAPDFYEYEYEEIQLPNGDWVKEGSFVRRNRRGEKLEEGAYRTGKRVGQWTFRNEDGSINEGRSGLFENDVRVQAGATPPGDYPNDPDQDFEERR